MTKTNKDILEVGMKVRLLSLRGSWENHHEFLNDDSNVAKSYVKNGYLRIFKIHNDCVVLGDKISAIHVDFNDVIIIY